MKIKVMTFNIHHGKGTDTKLNMNRIVKVMKESDADLIGLNEVDRNFSSRSEFMDQAAWLGEQLNMNHAYGAALTQNERGTGRLRQYGNALLSRYPIVSEKNHLFDFYSGLIEGRSLLETRLQIEGQALDVYITHLSLNPFLHKKQTDFILKKAADTKLPVLLLGDWNMRPGAKAWRKVTRHLTDVCDAAGTGSLHTFPSSRPRTQLDYIFVSRGFHIESAEVIKTIPEASDHLPLTAELVFSS
ncbi:endonuclease/exonuclease/phosphatase family protein [Effusibacillus lacus]|uniref:Endonuclease n=1 Tax=Effusibacillus lacus TaxID=1348429 RepID=A0A292YQP2_9BACL|nr:endonuclease/exonuclease/phosphatase family protein [Effusibacillus lacus]TCS71081.1 endonuclease/exonuclease/phosphatase family metal-dependent hydrolase [Effusibacillus lacus]GAX90724.1 endonuclease [Effusibacillus lacus]